MPRVAREWPTRAMWVLEDTKAQADSLGALFRTIDGLAHDAQVAVKDGKGLEAIIVLGDLRNRAVIGVGGTIEIKERLTKARNGDYD